MVDVFVMNSLYSFIQDLNHEGMIRLLLLPIRLRDTTITWSVMEMLGKATHHTTAANSLFKHKINVSPKNGCIVGRIWSFCYIWSWNLLKCGFWSYTLGGKCLNVFAISMHSSARYTCWFAYLLDPFRVIDSFEIRDCIYFDMVVVMVLGCRYLHLTTLFFVSPILYMQGSAERIVSQQQFFIEFSLLRYQLSL